jgi:hypothetical protein
MISVGLDWKMAIGACVLGNTIMGLVITINGRIGATVRCILQNTEPSLLDIASHSIPRSCTHAVWLLLCSIRRTVPLRPRRRLAWVSPSSHSLFTGRLPYAVFRPPLEDNVWRSYSQPSGPAIRTSPITSPTMKASPRKAWPHFCCISYFSSLSSAFLTPRYDRQPTLSP